ncbi:MAG: hypothetical protein NC123_00400 [Butyrivibrio sp.]|nr:hypothetical protein [Acetatifactor muris]MCM1557995.1 hypothetical protein [Butyrivibrio sp.]
MRKHKMSNVKMCFAALLLILSLMGTGCGDGRQTGDSSHPSQTVGMETAPNTGFMSYGYFFEENGIAISSTDRFMYSDWEPVEFDYICMDPTCSHLAGSCSAHTISGEGEVKKDFCLVYQERLIILHPYVRLDISQLSETVEEWLYVYQTDVYEADPDGSNRRKVAAFSGSVGSPTIVYAAVLTDGRLYFGGPTEERNRMEFNDQGELLSFESWVNDAVYCLELNDYTVETFAAAEDKAGEVAYSYQFYEYGGMIYAIISSFQGDNAVWYRIDSAGNVCEEILRFDSNVARFQGAIGNTVYYKYENSGKTLYAKDVPAGTEEREIMTVTKEDMILDAVISDGQILCMTDFCIEEGNPMAEYTVLDPNGNILDRIRYDDYIVLLGVVGDRILYFRGYPDWEVWWADKGELSKLPENGTGIGPLLGSKLDTMEE